MRTIEPIPRRKSRGLDDEPLVKDGIPAGRLGNRTFPTASMARQAAIAEANRLNQAIYPGHSVARSDAHRPGELPHYHVIDPQGKQISGHFFYGRKPYRVEPSRDGNLQQAIAAATRDLNPQLSDWQKERQYLQEKLNSGQATRQERGQLKWLNHKLLSATQQQKRRDAQRLGAEIHAARQSKQKAQREQEGEMRQQRQWLFEAPFVSELTEQINYHNFELMADREASTIVLRSLRFRSDSRLQATANNRPPMRQGERGLAVQKLQKALIDLKFPMPISIRRRGTPDGIYGTETTATVRKFQQKYGLKVDGVVGRNTMSRLDQLFASAPPPPPAPPVCNAISSSQCEAEFERCLKASNNPLACLAARSVCYRSCSPPTPPPLPTPTSTPKPPTARPCCILAPTIPNPFSPSNLVNPTALGTHRSKSEAVGLIYTGKAGFFDLGHVRDLCDLTKYVYDQIVAVKGAPVVIRTTHGTATIHTPVPSSAWIQVARAISYDDSFAYEIFTYDEFSPGGHNSSFSPEDLCSNYLGTLLAERAILAGGTFNASVTSQLSTMIGLLDAQTDAESLRAFNLINGCWVSFSSSTSVLNDAYLKRRNFDRIPWFTGHPSDGSSPAWVTAGFGTATTFYTYTHRLNRTIDKSDFPKEVARIRKDAAKRYGSRFDDRKCP